MAKRFPPDKNRQIKKKQNARFTSFRSHDPHSTYLKRSDILDSGNNPLFCSRFDLLIFFISFKKDSVWVAGRLAGALAASCLAGLAWPDLSSGKQKGLARHNGEKMKIKTASTPRTFNFTNDKTPTVIPKPHSNKLVTLEAMLVRNYDPLTWWLVVLLGRLWRIKMDDFFSL